MTSSPPPFHPEQPSSSPSQGQPGGWSQPAPPDFTKQPQPQPGQPAYGYPPPPNAAQAYGYPQAQGQPPYGQQQQSYGQPPYGQPPYGPPPNPYGGHYLNAVQKPTGWFIVNWLFLWPLAIYSLVSAWGNIDRALFAGDVAGAQYQANRVRKFGIIALCIGIVWIALWIIIVVAVGSSSCYGNYSC
jgi:interferon-induced transmembrane protein